MKESAIDLARVVLQSRFGCEQFRAGQEEAIASILAGRDTLVVLPTGGGKSICYQVPAMVLDGLTIVVSPLISLMKDQVDALRSRDLPAAFINSTLSSAEVSRTITAASRREVKLLYLAPERFDYGGITGRLRDIGVSLLAIDEAHCISQWGHDFRPSYLRVRKVRADLGAPPTMALTATATPEVRTDILRQLGLVKPSVIVTGFDRTNLTYSVLPARNDADKDRVLVETLETNDGLAIVYASTRRAVDRIAAVLERAGVSAAAYHAGLPDEARQQVQDAFMSERLRAIVATNAFGMGIDKPNVRLVIHHAMPGTLEAYYQEAGRAGRDGRSSRVYLVHSFPDRFTHEFFIKGSYPERVTVERVHDAIRHNQQRGKPTPQAPADVLALVGGKTSDREVESALRILSNAGAVQQQSGESNRVWVRLLAAPTRITRELGSAPIEIDFLRALWRVAGKRLDTGADVDLSTLPPGLGDIATAQRMLDSLAGRQFIVWQPVGSGIFSSQSDKPLSSYAIDWKLLDARRAGEMRKLEAMQSYVYTRRCRREFILRYFGDRAARTNCTGCDNCLGTTVRLDRTSATPRPTGKEDRRKSKRKDAQPAFISRADAGTIGPADQTLFDKLRETRTTIARAERMPAYIVFADSTLAEMARRRPRSLAALSGIRGVGDAKLARYGERFLEVIRATDETDAA
ncbi:MAG TPA: ATP-dependent DNA helicase RecQ [Gemmatimonadaceae bacterium]